jgi:hypothetical protein
LTFAADIYHYIKGERDTNVERGTALVVQVGKGQIAVAVYLGYVYLGYVSDHYSENHGVDGMRDKIHQLGRQFSYYISSYRFLIMARTADIVGRA